MADILRLHCQRTLTYRYVVLDIPTPAEIVAQCEAFCRRHAMAETRFGRDATGEPQLIDSIRKGRSPSLNVLHRMAAFMRSYEAGLGGGSSGESADVTDPARALNDCADAARKVA